MNTKSPLRKQKNRAFRAVSAIKEKFPEGSIINCYPFYDGNIELDLARADRYIVAQTGKYCIYEFWRCLMVDAPRIAEYASGIFPFDDPQLYNIYQDNLEKYRDPFIRASLFFVLNQVSDSGMVSNGKMDKEELNLINLSNLKRFSAENFHINFNKEDSYESFFESVPAGQKIMMTCGRYSENLLAAGQPLGPEETAIDHKKISNFFKSAARETVLLYYPSKTLMKEYGGYNIKMLNKYSMPTSNIENCTEVHIANF